MCYYNLRQLGLLQITTTFITIYDSLVITILDNCYYNLRQILQFTTIVITIYDRNYNSRQSRRVKLQTYYIPATDSEAIYRGFGGQFMNILKERVYCQRSRRAVEETQEAQKTSC